MIKIRPDFFYDAKIDDFSNELKTDPAQAIGYIVLLWFESQRRGLVEVSRNQIQRWLGRDVSNELIKSGLGVETFKGAVRICGNAAVLKSLAARKKSAKIAAVNRWEKPAKKSTVAKKPKKSDNSSKDFIAFYCEEYKSRLGTNPCINGSEAGAAKRMVNDLGLRESTRLVTAYLSMADRWFFTKGFDLKTMSNNLTKIKTFADTGNMLSSQVGQRAELCQQNASVIKRAMDEK